MNIAETYDDLVRARRDLWATLKSVPDEVLSRPLLDGSRFHGMKDIVMHIPDVEDGWTRGDILRDWMVQKGPVYAEFPLEMLLDYWPLVEQSTLVYLATLTDDELKRLVSMLDRPEERHTMDELLWHVMIHEMRHTAQIALLLRSQAIKPPSLDQLNYLPSA
jgi:uncharacterized damage-inducible protein DinB